MYTSPKPFLVFVVGAKNRRHSRCSFSLNSMLFLSELLIVPFLTTPQSFCCKMSLVGFDVDWYTLAKLFVFVVSLRKQG